MTDPRKHPIFGNLPKYKKANANLTGRQKTTGIKYKIIEGTHYHEKTKHKVCRVLARFLTDKKNQRIRVYYGDVETGRDWQEEYDITGYVGLSTGYIKVPLLLNNKASYVGGAIMDQSIVKIEHANKRQGGVLYQHPNYHKE